MMTSTLGVLESTQSKVQLPLLLALHPQPVPRKTTAVLFLEHPC